MGITAIALASLAVSAVAGYQQYEAAKDSAKAREEGQDIQAAQGTIEQRRGTRQAIREERIRRARIMQASENTGVSGSSSQFGSIAALSTLTGSNVAAGRGRTAAARGIGRTNQTALDAQTQGQLWGAVGQVSSSVFNASGGFGNFDIFNGGNTGGGQPIQGGFQSQIFTGN